MYKQADSCCHWYHGVPVLVRLEADRRKRRCRQDCACEHAWDCPLVWQFKKEVENEAS